MWVVSSLLFGKVHKASIQWRQEREQSQKNKEKGAGNAEIIHSVETKNEEIVNKVFK